MNGSSPSQDAPPVFYQIVVVKRFGKEVSWLLLTVNPQDFYSTSLHIGLEVKILTIKVLGPRSLLRDCGNDPT